MQMRKQDAYSGERPDSRNDRVQSSLILSGHDTAHQCKSRFYLRASNESPSVSRLVPSSPVMFRRIGARHLMARHGSFEFTRQGFSWHVQKPQGGTSLVSFFSPKE